MLISDYDDRECEVELNWLNWSQSIQFDVWILHSNIYGDANDWINLDQLLTISMIWLRVAWFQSEQFCCYGFSWSHVSGAMLIRCNLSNSIHWFDSIQPGSIDSSLCSWNLSDRFRLIELSLIEFLSPFLSLSLSLSLSIFLSLSVSFCPFLSLSLSFFLSSFLSLRGNWWNDISTVISYFQLLLIVLVVHVGGVPGVVE